MRTGHLVWEKSLVSCQLWVQSLSLVMLKSYFGSVIEGKKRLSLCSFFFFLCKKRILVKTQKIYRWWTSVKDHKKLQITKFQMWTYCFKKHFLTIKIKTFKVFLIFQRGYKIWWFLLSCITCSTCYRFHIVHNQDAATRTFYSLLANYVPHKYIHTHYKWRIVILYSIQSVISKTWFIKM